MKIIAIISEYNPFHLGHLNQINQIRKIFNNEEIAIISIMSGNFIQRGEPSIVDKFKRCKMALYSGINLCLELPIHVSLCSAEGFSFGSINLLNKLNIVDYLCFGCEIVNIETLNKLSDTLLSINKNTLSKYLNKGLSFPKSIELYIDEKFKDENITNFIKSPNNILAIEYLKAIKLLNSPIKVLPIERIGGGYLDEDLNNVYSSATSIRKKLLTFPEKIDVLKNHLPNISYEILKEQLKNNFIVDKNKIFTYLKYKLLTSKSLHKIEGVNEGIENKIYKEILNSNNLNDLILNVKSKRYTYSRISRILLKYFIGFENYNIEKIKNMNNYIRILGFDNTGVILLNKIKKLTSLELISNFNKKNSYLAPLDILGTKAYSLINNSVNPLEDFKTHPIIKS